MLSISHTSKRLIFNLTDRNGDCSFHNLCSLLTGFRKDVPPFGKKTTIDIFNKSRLSF